MSLTSDERAGIAGTNGRKSRGVATPEGKRRLRMNACKHYMTVKVIPMPTEVPARLEEHRAYWLDMGRNPVSSGLARPRRGTGYTSIVSTASQSHGRRRPPGRWCS
jgi:hypothetical protein